MATEVTARCVVIGTIVIGELALNTQTLRYAYALALCASIVFNVILARSAWSADSESDESLDEVVVVANRAPEPLSKVGNSVTVLGQQAIQDSQKVDMSALLATTPGITFSRGGGQVTPRASSSGAPTPITPWCSSMASCRQRPVLGSRQF